MEAAGWKTGPPGSAETSHAGLSRLLRKVAWLEGPDGTGRIELEGLASGAAVLHEGARGVLRAQIDGEHIHVFTERPDGAVDYHAASLGDWLAGLIEAGEPEERIPPRPVVELGHDGTGWGWDLAALNPPARLDVARVEAETGSRELLFGDGLVWAGQRVVALSDTPPERHDDESVADEPDLDDLFGEGGGRPRPRTSLVSMLLVVGLAFTVLGMLCISAPGGLLVLLAWYFVERDVERIESGYLPESERARVEVMRRFTYGGLLIVVALFALQGFLLCNGAYDWVLDEIYIPLWQAFIRSMMGAEVP